MVGVLSQDVVGPADFPGPVFVVPRAAYRRYLLEPRQFFVKLRQFFPVSELPRAARAVEQKHLVRRVEAALFPFLAEEAAVAHEWGNSRNGRNQQMVRSSITGLEREL